MSPADFDVRAVFAEELDKAVADEERSSGFPASEWFHSGPRDAQTALAKARDEDGPVWVQNFIDWYEHNPDVEVWVTPDGIPAIELPFEVMFGKVPVRGYIDLVLQAGSALIVTDIKSGAKAPANNRQLAIYAGAVEQAYGIRPRYGTWFMCRGTGPKAGPKTFFQRPIELNKPQYSVAYLTSEIEQLERAYQGQIYPAHPGDQCGRCSVAHACMEASGWQAYDLDPNWPRS